MMLLFSYTPYVIYHVLYFRNIFQTMSIKIYQACKFSGSSLCWTCFSACPPLPHWPTHPGSLQQPPLGSPCSNHCATRVSFPTGA